MKQNIDRRPNSRSIIFVKQLLNETDTRRKTSSLAPVFKPRKKKEIKCRDAQTNNINSS